jgi:hypothetical protein
VEGYPGGFHTQAIVSGGWGTTAALAHLSLLKEKSE